MSGQLRCFFILACMVRLMNAQTGPGGVGSSANNVLWLDANRGVTLSGSSVTNWADQSGNGFNAVPSSTAARPTFSASSQNGYPAFDFDGSNDELWVNDNAALDLTAWHFFIMPRVDLQKNYNAWLVKGNDGQENYEMLSFNDGNIHSPTFYTDATRTFPSTASGQVTTTEFNIIEYSYSSSVGRDVYKNGGSIGTDNESKTPSTNNFSLYIGNEKTTSRFINGDLAEVIAYNAVLNSAQRIIVNNYLAAKYNCTLTTNDLYTQDNSANGNYDHDVAGIGRVDASNIQNDSQGSGIVRILNPSGLGNGEYYFWGHDNGNLGPYQTSDYPSGLTARLVRVWRGTEVGTITSFDVRFDLTGLGPVTASHLRLLIDTNNDGLFSDETTGGGGIVSGASLVSGNVYQFTGVTGLNNDLRFTLGTTTASLTPLPIELLYLEASQEQHRVLLKWATASEKNNDHFDIERSENGTGFYALGSADGHGNSTARHTYAFYDEQPLEGTNYYRLKQVDHDASFNYSDIRSVEHSGKGRRFVISPNPSDGGVNVDVYGFMNQTVHLAIKGMANRTYLLKDVFVDSEKMTLRLDEGHDLSPGTYLVTLSSDEETLCQKLIIR